MAASTPELVVVVVVVGEGGNVEGEGHPIPVLMGLAVDCEDLLSPDSGEQSLHRLDRTDQDRLRWDRHHGSALQRLLRP